MSLPAVAPDELAAWLVDPPLAAAWQPALPGAAGRWSWFRDAATDCLARGALTLGVDARPVLPSLASAFAAWSETLDRVSRYEALDAQDHARFACGMLLHDLLVAQALDLRPDPAGAPRLPADRAPTAPGVLLRDPALALALRLSLTLLDGWHRALGAPALRPQPPGDAAGFIASCFENLREDGLQAPAFVDALTGAEPNWRVPTSVGERAAMRRAADRPRAG